jgi:predicted dehydrogenase
LLAALDYLSDVIACLISASLNTNGGTNGSMCMANKTGSELNSRSVWRHAFALFRHLEALVDGPSERVIPGVPDTSFRREWKHFADCILEKKNRADPFRTDLPPWISQSR